LFYLKVLDSDKMLDSLQKPIANSDDLNQAWPTQMRSVSEFIMMENLSTTVEDSMLSTQIITFVLTYMTSGSLSVLFGFMSFIVTLTHMLLINVIVPSSLSIMFE